MSGGQKKILKVPLDSPRHSKHPHQNGLCNELVYHKHCATLCTETCHNIQIQNTLKKDLMKSTIDCRWAGKNWYVTVICFK